MKPKKFFNQIHEFLVNNQWKFSLITILAVAFLFLKQTNYFEPFFSVPLLVFFISLWVFGILLFKLKPKFSIGLAIFSLLASATLLLLGIKPWAERATLYTYGFFVIGVAQELIYSFKRKKNA